jgi:serine/threonine protein kinase
LIASPEGVTNVTKAGNIGRFVKLADFGFSVIHEFDEQTHTEGSGTPKYPEVLSGGNYDMKADIYSSGVSSQDLFDVDIYS